MIYSTKFLLKIVYYMIYISTLKKKRKRKNADYNIRIVKTLFATFTK